MYECVECREVITNPLCPGCLKEAVVQWLSETAPQAVTDFRKLHRDIAPDTGIVKCISCRGKMDLCTHCYSKAVLTWLKQTPELRASSEEFMTYFNFELYPDEFREIPEEVLPQQAAG